MYTVRVEITLRSGRNAHGILLVHAGYTLYETLRADDYILLVSSRGYERIKKSELKEVRIVPRERE